MSTGNRLRVLYFLVFACTASWLPLFADYLKERGLTGIEIGMVLSITPFSMFLVQPIYGWLADRIGVKPCLTVSSFMAAACFLLFLFDGGFAFLISATLAMSLFYNALQPFLDSLSLDHVQSHPSFSYGTLRVAGAMGWAFTGMTVGQWIASVSTSVIFIASAGSLLLAFFISLTLPNAPKQKKSTTNNGASLRSILYHRQLLLLLFLVFLVSTAATTIWNFYSLYMKENGADAKLIGFGLSFQGVCELPFFYLSAAIIQRVGLRTTFIITMLSTAVRLLLYGLVNNPKAAIAIELLHGLSWSLFWVVCVSCIDRLVHTDWRATGQSVLYAIYFGAGQIAGNVWTGTLYDAHLRLADIFILNAVFVAGAAVVAFMFFKMPKET